MKQSSHLIRRYGNRKLYCCTESRYITLPEIAEKFLEGQWVCNQRDKNR